MIKLLLRELKKNWFNYLSMFVITALAMTLFLGFISNTITLRARTDLYFKEEKLTDLIVQTTGFTDEDRDYLLGLSAGTEFRIYSDGEFSCMDAGGAVGYNTAKIFVSDGELHRPIVAEGERGCMIDKTIADLRGYDVGEKITVEFTSYREAARRIAEEIGARIPEFLRPMIGEIEIPYVYEFTVTGLMYSVEGVNVYANSPVFLTPETLRQAITKAVAKQIPFLSEEAVGEQVAEIVGSLENQALIDTDDYVRVKEDIRTHFGEKEENNLVFVFDRDTMESVVVLDNEVSQSTNMLYIFPVIFFLVSILVLMTSISRLILRERLNIGTLKALGIGNGRIMLHYAFLGVVVTFLGCALGAAIGPPIVSAVMTIKYGLIFSLPMLTGIIYSAEWTLGATFVVCSLAMLIGLWASRSVIKENPAECMRPKQIGYHPRVRRGTGATASNRHILLSCRMAVRNIRINWKRSLMTVIGVMGCSALLVTSFGIGDTMNSSVENDYGYLFFFDVISPYAAEQEDAFFGELDSMRADGRVKSYERIRTYVATAQAQSNKDISVYIIPQDSAMSDITQNGNAISEITASVIGVKLGETLRFTLGSCTVEYVVENIVPTSTWNGFFATENAFSDDCYCAENVWVETDTPDEVRDALNEVNGTNTAKTMGDRIGEIESMISSTNAMKYTLMVFAVLLSVVVLYNLSLLNMKERSRDMATLKVIGFTDFQVALALFVEILALTLLGTAVGLCFGYPLMYAVMKLNEMATMAFIYSITPVSYLLSVLVSVGTGVAINAFFGLSVSRINMTESLKSVE